MSSVARNLFDYIIQNKCLCLLYVFLILVTLAVYKLYWSPIITKKELTEIGFYHFSREPHRHRKMARAQALRRMGNKIPPPYPNSWFAVAESRDLKIGSVISVDALGQNLCVYRGEDGVARCVDAYCPHLGANLAIGGSVCGNCIECPFHKWRFDEDGACVSVPGAEYAPKGVSIKKWHTVEANGAVWIWYDAENREPLWEMSDAPELRSMAFRGRNEFFIGTHIQDVTENGADMAHLREVHGPSCVANIGHHEWMGTWTKGDDHTFTSILSQSYKIMGYQVLMLEINIKQHGASHARLLVQSFAGPVLIIHSVTPVGPMLQQVVHRVFSPWYNAPLAVAILRNERIQLMRDIVLWNWKCFFPTPEYVRTDKTIRAFRNWHSQFYSPNSVSFQDATQKHLDW